LSWRSSLSQSLHQRSRPISPYENKRRAGNPTLTGLLLLWRLNERKIKMEILVFALVAMKLFKPKEKIVPEPHQFQPLDVQALKQVYNARVESSGRSSDRQESYAVEALS
jgi:hypothetical protein